MRFTNIVTHSMYLLSSLLLIFVCAVIFLTPKHFSNTGTDLKPLAVPDVTQTEQYLDYLRVGIAKKGPKEVQQHIKNLYDNASYGEQHMSLHYFGEILFELKGVSGLPECTDWYGFGCYHGFLLQAIETEGYDIVKYLDESCIQAHGYSMETETCQHGIGHGLLEFSGRRPLEALKKCDDVADVFPKLGCASGIFMEYFGPTESKNRSIAAMVPEYESGTPFDVCSELQGIRQATCVFEIHTWWVEVAKLNPREVEHLCGTLKDAEVMEFCLIGYGNFKGPDPEIALPFCDEFVELKNKVLCRSGVLWAAEHHRSIKDPARACMGLQPKDRNICFTKGRFTCVVEGNCLAEV
jgi:hypothetical protein